MAGLLKRAGESLLGQAGAEKRPSPAANFYLPAVAAGAFTVIDFVSDAKTQGFYPMHNYDVKSNESDNILEVRIDGNRSNSFIVAPREIYPVRETPTRSLHIYNLGTSTTTVNNVSVTAWNE